MSKKVRWLSLVFAFSFVAILGLSLIFSSTIQAQELGNRTSVATNHEENEEQFELEDSCEFSLSGAFTWALCSVFDLITVGLTGLEELIVGKDCEDEACDNRGGLIRVDSSDYNRVFKDSNGQDLSYKNAWAGVRNLMTFAVVGTALFMVISTTLDFGVFSNYTVKKYLPRLVVGTILIQLSWVLGDLFIYFVNSMGDLLSAVIYEAFPEAAEFRLSKIVDTSNWFEQLVIAGGAGLAGYAALVVLLPILGTLGLGLLAGWLFLELRQYIIILLLVLSPLGLAFWILPGNDRAWRFYSKSFFYLILLYPIIVLIITSAKIFSYLINMSG